ncbi:MAG: hypothetical protein R3F30_15130 [Planctomycetota bacterium]
MSPLDRFLSLRFADPTTGLSLDLSCMGVERAELEAEAPSFAAAFAGMAALEAGAVANPSEGRRVGHYWLRAPGLAPEPGIAEAIRATRARVEEFAAAVRGGAVAPPAGGCFTRLLLVGIGGSALGPSSSPRRCRGRPTGCARSSATTPTPRASAHARARRRAPHTLVLVVSKSGGTKETRNAMLEVRGWFERAGLALAPQAVAVTGEGSALDAQAEAERWPPASRCGTGSAAARAWRRPSGCCPPRCRATTSARPARRHGRDGSRHARRPRCSATSRRSWPRPGTRGDRRPRRATSS